MSVLHPFAQIVAELKQGAPVGHLLSCVPHFFGAGPDAPVKITMLITRSNMLETEKKKSARIKTGKNVWNGIKDNENAKKSVKNNTCA